MATRCTTGSNATELVGIPRRGTQPGGAAGDDTLIPMASRGTSLREFLRTEAAGGVVLVAAAVVALVWVNSPWSDSYHDFWDTVVTVGRGDRAVSMDLVHWINDGAMTLFFLVVGLEIKRELTSGHLAGRRAATLPVAAAIGGMVVPALVYLAIAGGEASRGWGVPMATDIALAVGVVSLAGSSVPNGMRALLLGLAVVDDIGAIVVIAIVYSTGVSAGWLVAAVGAVIATVVLRRLGVAPVLVYVALGTVLWYSLLEAGVHPTLAGVAMGLLAPVDRIAGFEHVLHPWTSFLVVPVFALANAGIEISADSIEHALDSPVTWGVLAGLVAGKPLGVVLASRLATRAGAADPPAGSTTRQLVGVGNAAGIGFTVAIFIAELAFVNDDPVTAAQHVDDAKLAILVASVVSGVVALMVLRQRRPSAAATADTMASAPTADE